MDAHDGNRLTPSSAHHCADRTSTRSQGIRVALQRFLFEGRVVLHLKPASRFNGRETCIAPQRP
jgi:hypothetical protein